MYLYSVFAYVCGYTCQRSEDNLWKLVLFFHKQIPGTEHRFSGFVAIVLSSWKVSCVPGLGYTVFYWMDVPQLIRQGWRLRAFTLPGDLDLFPCTHVAVHHYNSCSRNPVPSSGLHEHLHMCTNPYTCTYTHTKLKRICLKVNTEKYELSAFTVCL